MKHKQHYSTFVIGLKKKAGERGATKGVFSKVGRVRGAYFLLFEGGHTLMLLFEE